MQTSIPVRRRKNDTLAMLFVYGLLTLIAVAGVRQFTRAEANANAQAPEERIFWTPTPALPSPVPTDAPAVILAAPTLAPAPIAVDPVVFDVQPESAPQNGAHEADPPDTGSYLANVGDQAPHAIRDGETTPAIVPEDALNDPNQNGGNVAPVGCPFPIINGTCANGARAKDVPDDSAFGEKPIADAGQPPAHAEAPALVAVDVPPISADQAAIIGARESNGCPAGAVFVPRVGCHAIGSGGPMPGAVGEVRP